MKQNINIFDKKERKTHENAMTRDGQAKYTDTRNMFHYKKSWPKASFTNTRQAPNDKRSPDEVHNYQKHDFSKIAIFLLYYSKITKIYKKITLFQK